MSEEPQKPPLSLVSRFRESDYYGSFYQKLENPNDIIERNALLQSLHDSARFARLDDYKVLETANIITIYLRTENDVDRFNIARMETEEIEQEFLSVAPDFDLDALNRIRDELQQAADEGGFQESVLFDINEQDRRIDFLALSRRSYLDFEDYVVANRDKFAHHFEHRYDQPEFDLPYPTEMEAVTPNIIDATSQEKTKAQTPVAPESLGIIIGSRSVTDAKTQRNAPPFSLESKERDYPFIHYCDIEFPYDPNCRADEKAALRESISLIGARDYKLIDHNDYHELRFRNHVDDVHFTQIMEKDLNQPIQIDFFLPESKAKHASNLWKLKNCFKRTLVETGLQEAVGVRVNPERKSVSVSAASLAAYVLFWRQVPDSGRRKIITYDL